MSLETFATSDDRDLRNQGWDLVYSLKPDAPLLSPEEVAWYELKVAFAEVCYASTDLASAVSKLKIANWNGTNITRASDTVEAERAKLEARIDALRAREDECRALGVL